MLGNVPEVSQLLNIAPITHLLVLVLEEVARVLRGPCILP